MNSFEINESEYLTAFSEVFTPAGEAVSMFASEDLAAPTVIPTIAESAPTMTTANNDIFLQYLHYLYLTAMTNTQAQPHIEINGPVDINFDVIYIIINMLLDDPTYYGDMPDLVEIDDDDEEEEVDEEREDFYEDMPRLVVLNEEMIANMTEFVNSEDEEEEKPVILVSKEEKKSVTPVVNTWIPFLEGTAQVEEPYWRNEGEFEAGLATLIEGLSDDSPEYERLVDFLLDSIEESQRLTDMFADLLDSYEAQDGPEDKAGRQDFEGDCLIEAPETTVRGLIEHLKFLSQYDEKFDIVRGRRVRGHVEEDALLQRGRRRWM